MNFNIQTNGSSLNYYSGCILGDYFKLISNDSNINESCAERLFYKRLMENCDANVDFPSENECDYLDE